MNSHRHCCVDNSHSDLHSRDEFVAGTRQISCIHIMDAQSVQSAHIAFTKL